MKQQKVKFSVGDSVRIYKERGTFHRGYNEDFIGSFFQDELIHYNPPEFYEIDVLDTRGKGKKKEHLVHYRGWPNSYNEWKKAYDMKYM
jgi:hypothetical protein